MTTTDPMNAVLNQAPPLENFNRYLGNRPLRDAVLREGAGWAHDELAERGAELGSAEWVRRGELANASPPRLRGHDRDGRPADRFEFHPAWHECLGWLKQHGLAGAAWTQPRPGAQVRRAALFQLFAEVESGSLCPATMTHAAVPVLARDFGLIEPWVRLAQSTRHDPRFLPAASKRGVLIGMGVTERQGGSDVRANISRAEPAGDGWYRLTGHKWFMSATMSDAFLVTAQSAGGLGCFLLPRFGPDGGLNALHVRRAKDKLGDRSNATAEVVFDGALARLVGEEGRGIATVMEVAGLTRLDCANGSAGLMRAALSHALHHARHRSAFGKPLVAQPLMRNVLADMAVELEGHVAFCMAVAGCIDRRETSAEAGTLARLLVPALKYWVCGRTPALVAEAMEVLGGNGYVEDGPMPRLFRQSPLNSIWEGAGNMMCLDVLRALQREPACRDLLLDVLGRVRGIHAGYDRHLDALAGALAPQAAQEGDARRLAGRIALAMEAALLLAAGSPAGDALCSSRLAGDGWQGFGTLARNTDFAAILARADPERSDGD
ncbi:isovaleryl-CoA dehydrogenase [Thauera sinica]|uniref:Isovaleryl-CoA dehydrogenase n=1 Tax=Thauera sinica TaxID=2665146 RepID=A0ABW1ALZ6_9RHOO|nr:isovaleryl-CoA dehydrogenase [Thauera sp. K11]ATE59229.1 isovaleryl-CoA dehydrogenase [Thauera sp. K11]